MAENLFYRYPPGFKKFYGDINALSTCSRKIKVVILGINTIEKWNRTVESNHSADRVGRKRPPSYFAVAA